jgi:hypothetical protein
MKALCTLTFEFKDTETAKKVLRAVKSDDLGFVTSTVKGNILEAVVESSSVSSLLHTLDDYLSCVSVADSIVNKN